MVLVDTNVIFDILNNDLQWAEWSLASLERAVGMGEIAINDIIYAELSTRYSSVEDVNQVVAGLGLRHASIPRPALLLAGKAFQRYRSQGGTRTGVLSDFFIGAHASVEDWPLLTRDAARVRSYFPAVTLIAP